MAVRIIAGVIAAPIFLYALVAFPPVFVALILACISAVASFELLHTTGSAPRKSVYVVTACAATLIPFTCLAGVESWGLWAMALALLCALFFLAIIGYEKETHLTVEMILYALLGGVIIPGFLTSLLRLRMMENGKLAVLLPVIIAFATDSGAYFVGVFLGKHRGITKVSPNKSVEGFVGGIIIGTGFMLLYGLLLRNYIHLEVNFARLALYGVVGGLVTELGDLSFSLIKRQFGAKDYGKFLPGHGGMLDRFDSMSFVAPTIWVLMSIIPAL